MHGQPAPAAPSRPMPTLAAPATLLMALLAAALAAAPASAQADAGAQLTLDPVDQVGGPALPGVRGPALEVGWTYSYPSAAAASTMASGDAVLSFALDCGPGVSSPGNSTLVRFEPAVAEYRGVARLMLEVEPEAEGDRGAPCTVHATADGATDLASATADVRATAAIGFAGALRLAARDSSATAGPQEQVSFELEVENLSNAKAAARFAILDDVPGGWAVVVPEDVILERGETRTVALIASTPFENGPNSGHAAFRVQATPRSVRDPDAAGEPQEVVLEAGVKGWYVPGPGVAVALPLLAAAAMRRRA